jgi:hypothetical protein
MFNFVIDKEKINEIYDILHDYKIKLSNLNATSTQQDFKNYVVNEQLVNISKELISLKKIQSEINLLLDYLKLEYVENPPEKEYPKLVKKGTINAKNKKN